MKNLIFIFIMSCAVVFAQEYHIDKSKENLVKFISDAPLEDIEGVTNSIDGYMYLISVDDLTDNQLYFEVDLTTIDTGIELRNRHMRDNYLETEKYRFTFFEGKIDKVSKATGENYDVDVSGKIFIHGVTKDINVKGTLKKSGDGYHVETDFTVALSDYSIDIPQLMFMKIDEEMQVVLKFYLNVFTQSEG